MKAYGKLFEGTWMRFDTEERDHAQHLLADGGTTCHCQGVRAHNGKFRAFPFNSIGDPLLIWPNDLIEETSEEPENVMNWKSY